MLHGDIKYVSLKNTAINFQKIVSKTVLHFAKKQSFRRDHNKVEHPNKALGVSHV